MLAFVDFFFIKIGSQTNMLERTKLYPATVRLSSRLKINILLLRENLPTNITAGKFYW